MIKRPNWDQHDWRAPQERRRRGDSSGLPAVKTLRDAEQLVMAVFLHVQRQLGLETARRIFANYSEEPTKTQRDLLEKLQWLERLDTMTPKPNISQLARDILEERGVVPSDPGYQNQLESLDHQIRRVKRRRQEVEAMHGPISPPLAKDEPASFRILRRKKK